MPMISCEKVYMNYDSNDENIDFERDAVKKYFGGDIETDDVVDSYTFDTTESGEIIFFVLNVPP